MVTSSQANWPRQDSRNASFPSWKAHRFDDSKGLNFLKGL